MPLRLTAAMVVSLALLPPATGAEPPHYAFSPKPPGEIVQSALFYPTGEGMQSQWRAVASRTHLEGSAYQWYLSIYSIDYDTATYHRVYQSPRDGGPALLVTRVRPSGLWFPLQTLHIVGEGQFEEPGVENLVVQEHHAAADCGSASVTVFGYDWTKMRVRAFVTAANPCALQATVEHQRGGDAIRLVGPYYAPGAALCCPTRPRVSAYLRFKDDRWVEAPSYFPLHT